MNKNNLSWVDNKVFNNPGSTQSATPPMRPFMDTAPAQYQAAPAPAQMAPSQTGVSPATYQGMTSKAPPPTGVSPATYQDMTPKAPTPTGVSPATYQDMTPKAPTPTGVSPATYQESPAGNLNQAGLSPAQFQAPTNTSNQMGVSPAQFQAPSNTSNPMGISPAQFQKDPVVYPVQTGTAPSGSTAIGMGMPGISTRDDAYAQNPVFNVPGPPSVMDPGYIPGYLRTQIGKRIRAEFILGTNTYMDRTGILRYVGYNYFVLEDNVTHVMIMCDLYSVKFVSSL